MLLSLWAARFCDGCVWGQSYVSYLSLETTSREGGGGNGNPLQCSCLENPRDRGAWWAAVYGVTQSRTRLKWLSSSREGTCEEKIERHEITYWECFAAYTVHLCLWQSNDSPFVSQGYILPEIGSKEKVRGANLSSLQVELFYLNVPFSFGVQSLIWCSNFFQNCGEVKSNIWWSY